MLAELAFILGMVPLCSYVRVERLQGITLANSLPSTTRTPCLAASSSVTGRSRPAVLLPCWALGAEPEDLLAALQPGVVGKIALSCIALMIPLC